jgi:hypothetical protein
VARRSTLVRALNLAPDRRPVPRRERSDSMIRMFNEVLTVFVVIGLLLWVLTSL